ncbi:MAG TPA: UbiA-like polyprenyltransferase [Candidatus Eisenbacteria bacterium]|nr:UbiA-like polyprenyltransferase [Candidatus Eisenbacteria bacterium]
MFSNGAECYCRRPLMVTATAPAATPLERLRTYGSFVRFEHTLFSLPLVLAGVFSAPGPALPLMRWLLVAIAAVGARTAAMALNRLIDRRLDAINPRTRARELPAGRMRASEAWLLLAGSVLAYLLACAALGPWFLRVAAIPLAVFTVYPYLKRFTPFCHFGVGAALALAPLAGFAAAHPDLSRSVPALWLAAFAFLWVSGFDIIYATLDEAFDREHRVRSMVEWLGRRVALRWAAVLHAAAFACLVAAVAPLLGAAPRVASWAMPATLVMLAATGVLLYLEQRWAEDVDLAFFKVNVFVGLGVLATVLAARAAGGF